MPTLVSWDAELMAQSREEELVINKEASTAQSHQAIHRQESGTVVPWQEEAENFPCNCYSWGGSLGAALPVQLQLGASHQAYAEQSCIAAESSCNETTACLLKLVSMPCSMGSH